MHCAGDFNIYMEQGHLKIDYMHRSHNLKHSFKFCSINLKRFHLSQISSEIRVRFTFCLYILIKAFLFQTDLRTIGKKFLPSDINGGKVEKVKNNVTLMLLYNKK